MAAYSSSQWHALPAEMKLSVVDFLDLDDVNSFAKVNRESYSLSVPALWRSVDLKSIQALQSYLSHVPSSYHTHIRQLKICTKPSSQLDSAQSFQAVSDALFALLSSCPQVEQLTLTLESSPSKIIIPCFYHMINLSDLSILHCGDEQLAPLSERLVVAIAAAVPNLVHLSLDRIARSAIHAPELVGAYPFVPVVVGDDDIPACPVLGEELSLPSLLRLPTLKRLRIRDTHLGDSRWSTTHVSCSLEVLDLGSCCHESPDFNRVCTERIVSNVGHTVGEFSLSAALSIEAFNSAHEEPPLKRLRKIHLTPLFPVENVVDTLTTLSDSPVEQLSVKCFEDDVVDMCAALEDVLSLRVERGEGAFLKNLTNITFDTVDSEYFDVGFHDDISDKRQGVTIAAEQATAIKHLLEFCRDLRLADEASSNSSSAEKFKDIAALAAASGLASDVPSPAGWA
ncbi:hypothetical protein ABKN59_000892 [Abortiporus biennis]